MAGHKKRRKLNDGTLAAPADPSENTQVEAETKDPRTLFVRLLAPTVTTEDLAAHFSQSYPIKHAVAVLDKDTKQCKGYGFVTFADLEDAKRAIEELHASELHSRRIQVEQAQARHRSDDGLTKTTRTKQEQRQPTPKLIVRNLPWSIDHSEKLAHLFKSFGKINQVVLPKNSSGRLLGFGIVIIRGKKNAEHALETMNGKEVDGRTLAVDWAADRETWERSKQAEVEADKERAKASKKRSLEDTAELDDSDPSRGNAEAALGSNSEMSDKELDSNASLDMDDDEDVNDEVGSNTDSDEHEPPKPRMDATDSTIFVRNLPFSCEDDNLRDHFEQFGRIRYSRVVYDHATEQSRGSGFVCFSRKEDAEACVREAPQTETGSNLPEAKGGHKDRSVLQDEALDPTGRYSMEGRILIVTNAVEKNEANRLLEEGVQRRNARDKDRRRLYLLNEGRISSKSPLFEKLSPSEIAMRDTSAKQRKKLVESNPSLHLSLTRLSVRNIPRSLTSKDLKALARTALVGFAEDVKNGTRQKLSKEELARGGDDMKEAERQRKLKGVGVVRQAKVVFESKEGSKVQEVDGAGRSRGYGFIEYYTHRSALMALRWLNGHQVDQKVATTVKNGSDTAAGDRKRRLIVEFALENVNVVNRRKEREGKMARIDRRQGEAVDGAEDMKEGGRDRGKKRAIRKSGQQQRTQVANGTKMEVTVAADATKSGNSDAKGHKLAQRQRIITKKRMARRARKKGLA